MIAAVLLCLAAPMPRQAPLPPQCPPLRIVAAPAVVRCHVQAAPVLLHWPAPVIRYYPQPSPWQAAPAYSSPFFRGGAACPPGGG